MNYFTYHKDYTQRSAAITLAIFDDRMEIWNNGILPRQLKLEDLKKKHRSYPRNKLIANAFYMRGLIETWGTGTAKMLERCKAHGIPDPIFEEYSGGVAVQFMFEGSIGLHSAIAKSVPHVSEQKSLSLERLPKRQLEIVEILKHVTELRAADIMKRLIKPPSERTLRDDLAALKKLKIINSRGRGLHAVWYKR